MIADIEEDYDWMKADCQTGIREDGPFIDIRFYKNNIGRGSVNLEISYNKVKQILGQLPDYELTTVWLRFTPRGGLKNLLNSVTNKFLLCKYKEDFKKSSNIMDKVKFDKLSNIENYITLEAYELIIFQIRPKVKQNFFKRLINRFK